jgi:flagellin
VKAAIAASSVAGRVNFDHGDTTASRFTISGSDSDVDITIQANATTEDLFLTTDNTTDRNVNGTNLLDASAISGDVLTVQANGGTARSITFGTGADQVSTFAELQTALAGSNVSVSRNSTTGFLTFSAPATVGTQNALVISGTAAGAGAGNIGIAAGTTNGTGTPPAADATRTNYQTQFNNLLTQIDALAKDASYNGINLLNGDALKVVFNEKGSSSLTITGVKFDATGLGLNAISGTGFQTNANIDATIAQIDSSLSTLRTQASNFGSSLTTVQTRQDFTKNLITTLQTGADALVLADTNEEGANLLALQTRQQLSTTALSLANQASQAVLRLF